MESKTYEDMTKTELCIRVAQVWFDDVIQYGVNKDGSIYIDRSAEDCELVDFDPIDNPSDAWPIMKQTFMSVELAHPELGQCGTNTIYNPMGADWQCDYEDNDQCFRAAMICFLKMKDAEQ